MKRFLLKLEELKVDSIREFVDLSTMTWLKVGGKARLFFRPESEEELVKVLKTVPSDLKIFTLGAGSNLLVRDGGINGLVIRLSSKFAKILYNKESNLLYAGASLLMPMVSKFCLDNNLTGLEFLSGIPGTVGGGVKMNAGSYGNAHDKVIEKVEIYTRDGNKKVLTKDDLEYSYRHSSIGCDEIVVGAYYRVNAGSSKEILAKIDEIREKRNITQPKVRTSGSTFANPEGYKAWELIDKVGGRGFVIGDACFSEKHCNFLINKNKATAKDLEAVGEEIRKRVKIQFDIDLRWEVQIVGDKI